MTISILLAGVVIMICVLLHKLSHKIGIPMLLAFILLGMLFGSDGILRISFENYDFSQQVCSVALIFIMFYGGFGTNWDQARPVAVKAGLLSTLGVVLTAGLTGLFCHWALAIPLAESLLIGAVIGSTDAASVFSILRSKKLGLRDGTDSMLELESGSNDPSSYMLTVVMLSVMGGSAQPGALVLLVLSQLFFGVVVGLALAFAAGFVLRRLRFETAGFDMVFMIGVALLSYALASALGGNGYLSAYLCGICLGNVHLPNKGPLVHFFDGLTGLMQMLIFFLLGLLSTPSRLPAIFLPALAIMLFLTLVARPAAVFALLAPFRGRLEQTLLVSFSGLRGAASIVFAIMAIVARPDLHNDLFHIVFCIVLLSITFQGSLLPLVARRLGMSDQSIDVMKTFSDYSESTDLHFIKVKVRADHPWAGKPLRDLTLPPDTLAVLLLRGGAHLVPSGKTVLQPGDTAVLSAYEYTGDDAICLREQHISEDSRWIGQPISEFSPNPNELVILIIRGTRTVIPAGATAIEKGDVLVINSM